MINVRNLTKQFKVYKKQPGFLGAIKGLYERKTETIEAVNDISFDIDRGEIVGYIGSNGAGKSTTIKMMCGILAPTSGEVIVDGIKPYKNRVENAKKIGVVFGQRTQLWWDLALGETYSILKEVYQVNNKHFKERMEYFNDILGINDFLRQPVRTLSLGQRMRADLVASMIHNPSVLYLDEPTIGMDILVKEKMRKAIQEMNKTFGTTVILTTHDMSDIEELSSRIIIVDKGKKIYDGDKKSLSSKFIQKRKISFELVSDSKFKELKQQIINRDKDSEVIINDRNLSISFNETNIETPELITVVMKYMKVKDLKIVQNDIGEVIKEFYKGVK